jgi:hypothetical protein
MTPLDRLERINQLQRDNDAARERLAEEERRRAADPIKMDDYRRAEQEAEAAAERDAYVRHRADERGMIHKTTRDALVSVPMADADAENERGWNEWVKAHLANERAEMMDIVARAMAEFTSEYTRERLQPLEAEIAELRRVLAERDERSKALAEIKREFAGERAEAEALQLASALAARDHRIEQLETQVRMLCGFLSVGGYTLPKDL